MYGIILNELYSFAEAKYGYAYEKAYYVDLSACTDIAGATHFAFSSLKTFMYYAVGRKVYRVNFSNAAPAAELQFELPEGEEITCLKFYLWEQEDTDNRSYDLIVGARKMIRARVHCVFMTDSRMKAISRMPFRNDTPVLQILWT